MIREKFGRYWHLILLAVGLISFITGVVLITDRTRFAGTLLETIGELLFLLGSLALGIVILYALSVIVHRIRGK